MYSVNCEHGNHDEQLHSFLALRLGRNCGVPYLFSLAPVPGLVVACRSNGIHRGYSFIAHPPQSYYTRILLLPVISKSGSFSTQDTRPPTMKRAFAVVESLFQSPVQFGLLFCALALLTQKLAHIRSNRRRNSSRLPLPPGPKGYPIIDHVLDMPTSQQWRIYAQWAKVYGKSLHCQSL